MLRGRGGGGWQARDPVPSGDEVFGWCDGSYAEYATAGEDHFAPKPTTGLPRFVLAEFTTRTIKLCGGSWASSALSLWSSLHLSRARKGQSEAFLDVAPNPNRARRPPDHEVVEHGDGQRDVHPRI